MIFFSSSVSAQQVAVELSFAVGDGAGTPAAGQQLVFDIHARRNNEPNAPAGTKYLAIKFVQNGKQLVGGLMQLSSQQEQKIQAANAKKDVFAIKKVENPLPIRKYDGLKVTLYDKASYFQIEVIQGNKKNLGKMKIYY